ncbi:MAG: molybdopterin-dependent oxidoreductase [Anaerolineae bacterium]
MQPRTKTLLITGLGLITGLFLYSCSTGTPPSPGTPQATSITTPAAPTSATITSNCGLSPVQTPPQPAVTPELYGLDPATGLHVTGSLHDIDIDSYRLKVTGLVTTELSLTYDELRCLPKVTSQETLNCPGFFTDIATWSGVPFKVLLDLAGVKPGAREMRLIATDGYAGSFPLADAYQPGFYLAYELEGQPVPQMHGFPVRAVLRGKPGFEWVKWLDEVQVR